MARTPLRRARTGEGPRPVRGPGAPRLDLPAGEGARQLALARLDEADAARVRLEADDAEALHDFRVALRRLRTALRAFRPWLAGGPRGRHGRRLAEIAEATNAFRDAQVQLAWLAAQRDGLAPRPRAGVEWLAARYEARRAEGAAAVEALRSWDRLAPALRERLAPGPRELASGEAFGGVVAALLRKGLSKLLTALDRVSGPDDAAHAHRARIEGKRLRYLLEPLRPVSGLGAREAVRRLKRLQDLLGEHHDAQVLIDEIAAAREEKRGGPRPPALAAVERLARARRDGLHRALAGEVTAGALVALGAQVRRVADGLESRARSGFPPRAPGSGKATPVYGAR